MIRKIIIVLLIILLIFIIWKFNIDKKKAKDESTINLVENDIFQVPDYGDFKDEWRTFEDKIGGYKINYPADWLIESKTDTDDMIRADIAYGQRAGFQIRKLEYTSNEFNNFLDSYLENFKEEMVSHWKGEFHNEQRSVDNRIDHNFSRTTFKFLAENGTEWLFIEFVWQKDKTVIAFQCGLEYDFMDQYLPIFDSISDSFEFIE